MEKQIVTPEESLRIISEMIHKTKEEYESNSFYFLLWGYIISLACLLQFAIIKGFLAFGMHNKIDVASVILWGGLIFTGILIQYIYMARNRNSVRVKTYISEFLGIHWQINGALILLAGLFCWKFDIYPSSFILAICGAATLTSGVLIKHRSLITGSGFLLTFAIINLWVTSEFQLILTALAVILGYIIPGYSLRTSKK